ncbi:MAG: hypothetical protein AAB278_00335 [Pseudomonadota bacterium]
MVDMALIQGAITGLKTAGDIAKGFLELKSIADVQGKVIELQSAILSAQSSALAAQGEQSSLVQRIRDLEDEITNVKAWGTQKIRYKLASPCDGSMVYALQKSMCDGEPPHYICTNCYQAGKRSILQIRQPTNSIQLTVFVCPICKAEAPTQYKGAVAPKYADELIKE